MAASVIFLPERLDPHAIEAMRAQLAKASHADAVVFEGAPNRFCVGMDLTKTAAPGAAGSDDLRHALESFAFLVEEILNAPRPTLAVVDGPALGGGLGLAAACDFVLATEQARFGLPEALYGLTPAIIRSALMTRLTAQKLNMLLFTCHSREPADAQALGLVDRIVPQDQVETAKREIVRQFRRARSDTVIAVRRWNAAAFTQALKAGTLETNAALSDENVIRALRAAGADEDLPWSK